jgi:hypothetical protein
LVTGVIAAFAIALPVAEASAATPRAAPPPARAAFGPLPWTFVPGTVGGVLFVYGGLVYGDVFNGGVSAVDSTGPAYSVVIDSP